MSKTITMIHLEDDPADAELVQAMIKSAGLDTSIIRVQTRAEMEEAVGRHCFDLILADYNLPGYDGISALQLAKEKCPDIPFIFVSGTIGEDAAIEGLVMGATDYVLKQRLTRLAPAIKRAMNEAENRRERMRAEEASRRMNRELRAISDCNQTLMRAVDEESLLNDICRIICEEAGYRLVWVGFAEHDENKTVKPVAWAGIDGAIVADAKISWADEPGQRYGLVGSVIRNAEIIYVQDFSTDSRTESFHDVMERYGYRSGIALPLKDEHAQVFGALIIFSGEANAFTPDEIRLLDELAGDLAFGIITLRTRTERKRAEEELRVSEQRFSIAFASSPIASAIFREADGRIIDVNDVFVKSTGYSREEIIGHTTQELNVYVDPSDRDVILRTIRERGSVENFEFRMRKKSGEIGIGLNSTVLIEIGGERHLLATILDITERKRGEEKLREMEERRHQLELELIQSQKLESLGTLASGIAHDFNNILSIILGYSSLGEQCYANSAQALKNFSTITKAADRGASLVKQLLTLARKTETMLHAVDINTVIAEITGLISETFPKTILILTHLQKNLPPITADSTQLHQVFVNLCVNARDAMPQGGSLTIATSMVPNAALVTRFPKATAQQYALISVTDTGIGMDERTMKKIFDPFFSTKGPGKGTGLGLALVYSIVTNHHGMIEVDSKPGQGTTFHVYFPSEETHADIAPQSLADVTELAGGTETVLVIEDEEMLVDMLHTVLTNKGYTVFSAQDGEEGIGLFVRHRAEVAVVLTDLGLPKVRGDEVVMRLKEIDPHAKIILASGFIEPEIKAAAVQMGISRFIQKPYSYTDVIQTVREVIDMPA